MQSDLKIKPVFEHLESFLDEGAIVQTAADSFKLFIGPFTSVDSLNTETDLLFKPDFWDFIKQTPIELNLLKAQKVIDLNKQQICEIFLSDSVSILDTRINWQDADPTSFQQQFNWLQRQINAGDLLKGLPITVQYGECFTAVSKIEILKNILHKKSEQYLYGFWCQATGCIGFTPEILIDSKNGEISTMALAGTWSKQSEILPDFKNSKIQNEHQIVVRDILSQLSDHALILKSEVEVLELEYLYHLKTRLRYLSADIKKFIQKLHPTAALGLFPRSKKMFTEFEKFELQRQRQNFGAPFGFIGKKQSFLLVAIRNIFWNEKKISIYSGCGVTAESDFKTEWLELEAKRNSVKKTFGLSL